MYLSVAIVYLEICRGVSFRDECWAWTWYQSNCVVFGKKQTWFSIATRLLKPLSENETYELPFVIFLPQLQTKREIRTNTKLKEGHWRVGGAKICKICTFFKEWQIHIKATRNSDSRSAKGCQIGHLERKRHTNSLSSGVAYMDGRLQVASLVEFEGGSAA